MPAMVSCTLAVLTATNVSSLAICPTAAGSFSDTTHCSKLLRASSMPHPCVVDSVTYWFVVWRASRAVERSIVRIMGWGSTMPPVLVGRDNRLSQKADIASIEFLTENKGQRKFCK